MQENILSQVRAARSLYSALTADCRHRLERDHNCSALATATAAAATIKSEEDWLKSFGSSSVKFKNAPESAVGDPKIPEADRFLLAVNFPQALQRPPMCVASLCRSSCSSHQRAGTPLSARNGPQAKFMPPLSSRCSWPMLQLDSSVLQVLDSLCSLGKIPNQNNEAGCENKLRLFTLKGRRLENMQVEPAAAAVLLCSLTACR
jgi:hypothetical protein